jgi:hypothetical protein
LLAWPPTVTTTLPVVAPAGTGTTMLVALQLVGVASVPLNVIVLAPWVAPKFVPVTVTDVPTGPEVGLRLVMLRLVVVATVKLTPLLACPPTVTATFPVVAPLGTVTAMLVALQLDGVATAPLNVTVLVPWLDPKFVPVIVTDVPTGPEVGLRPVILGLVVVTVKLTPLLACPPTVTTTFPVPAPLGTVATMLVALQLVGVATVPLNVTALAPCVDPKFVPVIVTDVPTGPELGLTLVMLGVSGGFGQLLARLAALTLPIPVAKSQPVAAPYAGLYVRFEVESTPSCAKSRSQLCRPVQLTSMSPCVMS